MGWANLQPIVPTIKAKITAPNIFIASLIKHFLQRALFVAGLLKQFAQNSLVISTTSHFAHLLKFRLDSTFSSFPQL